MEVDEAALAVECVEALACEEEDFEDDVGTTVEPVDAPEPMGAVEDTEVDEDMAAVEVELDTMEYSELLVTATSELLARTELESADQPVVRDDDTELSAADNVEEEDEEEGEELASFGRATCSHTLGQVRSLPSSAESGSSPPASQTSQRGLEGLAGGEAVASGCCMAAFSMGDGRPYEPGRLAKRTTVP